jgi:cysteine desulfurase/selenocysteine lyase
VKTGLPGEALADAAASELRKRLPLLEGGVSLNHAGISPQPESTAIADFEETRASLLPGEALARISGLRDEIRRLYAGLLQVTPAEIAITRHTAEGVNLIAQGFPWKNGDRIVTVSVEYPSNVYPWWNLRSRGVEIVPVPEREGRVDLDELLGAIDERVRVVAISHVEFASGFCFDLERLSARCRTMGVFLFVDIAQSVGLLPIDLRLVDAAAWPTWKWLMGPIGMGGLYLAANHLESIRPIFVGSDGMVPTTDYLDYRFEFRAGAARFEYSTENVLGLIGMAEALRRIAPLFGREAGDVVVRRVLETGDLLISRLEGKGLRLYSSRQPGERSGIFSFVAPGNPAQLASRLRRSGVEVAVRGGRLRVSPHFYNNAADIERLLAAL